MGFVSGPRQVGKTTLVRRLLRESGCAGGYFSWDIEAHRRSIVRDPEGFWRSSAPSGRQPVVALDEIHKYPRWKRFLKGLFDAAGREVKILVTGSGRLDVHQRGGDSLLGRYGLYRLHPFSVGELLDAKPGGAPGPEEALAEKLMGHPVSGLGVAYGTVKGWVEALERLYYFF